MIPWLIIVKTDLLPDQLFFKLDEMTGTEFKTPYRIFGNTDYSATRTRSFAGHVGSRTFRLVRDPHWMGVRWRLRTVYQGYISVMENKCHIWVLVRPSVLGLGIFAFFLWVTYKLILMANGHFSVAILLVPLWSIMAFSTFWEVRKAREMFERLFPDVERPVVKKERPFKLSRKKW